MAVKWVRSRKGGLRCDKCGEAIWPGDIYLRGTQPKRTLCKQHGAPVFLAAARRLLQALNVA